MGDHRHIRRLHRSGAARRFPERHVVYAQQQRPESDEQSSDQRQGEERLAGEGGTHDQELAHEDAERRKAGDGGDADHETPTQQGMRHRQAANIGKFLRALGLGNMADGEENRRLREAVHRHVEEAREVGERSTHAEREGDDAHVLDGRVGEHPLHVAAAVQHESSEHERGEPHRRHQRAGCDRRGVGGEQELEAQHSVERDVEQQARENGRDRRRAFGVRIGQPGVQGREPHLRAVAEDQEDERDVQQRRIEGGDARDQHCPNHAVEAFSDDRPGGHIDEDRAEECERDAHAAEDEVLPGRLDRRFGAVDADHNHRGQGRHFDRHPHESDIVGHQGEVHGEQQRLVHGVVEAQMQRRQSPALEFMGDVARAEEAGREADEGIEDDEDDIEVVDQDVGPRLGLVDEQGQRREEREKCRHDVERGRQPIARQHCEQQGGDGGNCQD